MQIRDWERIFTVHVSDKGLEPRIHKALLQNSKGERSCFKHWAKPLNMKEAIQMANKNMTRDPTKLFNRDMQIKSIMTSL